MTSAVITPAQSISPPRRGLTATALRRFARRPVAVAALLVVIALFIAGALAHIIAPHGWNWINLSSTAVQRAPSLSHPFGTDQIGRDMLDRTLYGIRTTEEVALASVGIATIIGVVVGAISGFYGGWLDALLMRLADLVTAYPAVVLTLAAIVYLRQAYPHDLILIYGAIMWAIVARAVRATIVSLREHEFVEAARALGASDCRILFRHLVPNTGGTIAVAATSLLGQIVLIDATVEFFNYGLSSSVAPSLGNLVSDVVQAKFGFGTGGTVPGSTNWWIWIPPGVVLVLILVCLNLVGDALDAALNPGAANA